MFTHPSRPTPVPLLPTAVPGPSSHALASIPARDAISSDGRNKQTETDGSGPPSRSSSDPSSSSVAVRATASRLQSGATPAAGPKRRAPSATASSSASSHAAVSKREYEYLLSLNGKLEAKAAKAEHRLREANVERAKLRDEADLARRDLRHKETAFRAQLEKADGGAQDTSAARKRDAEMARRVDELRQIHRDDKAKWTAKIASLEADLQAATSKADGQKDRGRLVEARVEWDAEKLRLLGEVREEKQAARRAAKDKDSIEIEAARLRTLVDDLEIRLDDAQDAAVTSLDEAETLRALLADASALYGHLSSSTVDQALYDAERARVRELERDLTTAHARLLPVRVSRQHQKDLTERVQTLEALLAGSDEAVKALHDALRSVVDESVGKLSMPDRVVTDATSDARVTADCFGVALQIETVVGEHLSARTAELERQNRTLSTRAFDDGLESADVADRLNTAVALTTDLEGRLTHAETALSKHAAELKTTVAELDAVRTRETDARSALAALQATHASAEQERGLVERELKTALRKAEEALVAERDHIKRLASTVGQGRVAQDALRSDLDKAQRALADAQEFEAAYTSQLKENAILSELTDLAEDEARTLAAQNAEILGQNNLNQRITYLGKLRSELIDYKQHAVTLSHDIQELTRENASLKDELASYKPLSTTSRPPPRTLPGGHSLARVSRRQQQQQSQVPSTASLGPSSGGGRQVLGVARSSAANNGSFAGGRGSTTTLMMGGKGGKGGARTEQDEGEGDEDWTQQGQLTLADLM